jgi:hypothetical protein
MPRIMNKKAEANKVPMIEEIDPDNMKIIYDSIKPIKLIKVDLDYKCAELIKKYGLDNVRKTINNIARKERDGKKCDGWYE